VYPLIPLLLLPAVAQVSVESQAQVADRVVVVVGDSVITAGDVRLTTALDERDASPARELLDASAPDVQRLIDAAIIRRLAGDVPVYQPTQGTVRTRVEAFQRSWADPREYHFFLSEHGIDEARLITRMFSRLIVEAYIHRNLSRSGEDADIAQRRARYAKWIAAHRAGAQVRHVAPLDPR
jgi:hypothetical protein